MLEADVLMREADPKEPIMAHPPDKDSDITLEEWLREVKEHQKGIKLDFKRFGSINVSFEPNKKPLQVMLTRRFLQQPGGRGSVFGSSAEGVGSDEPSSVDQCRRPAWPRGPRPALGPPGFPLCCGSSAPSHGAVSGVDDRLDGWDQEPR